MYLNMLVFFILTIFSTMHLSSSDKNFQAGPKFKATDTRKISQQNADNNPQITSQKAPLTKNSSPGDLECNITPEPYRISPEKLLELEKEFAKLRQQNKHKPLYDN